MFSVYLEDKITISDQIVMKRAAIFFFSEKTKKKHASKQVLLCLVYEAIFFLNS